ncbi:MAG: AEC family transporter [Candidatus Cloacimonetes bacterium]|nr:AEC family transporter [Candidatus Cloacimonadota bacterium]
MSIYLKLFPIFLMFILGFFSKRLRLFGDKSADIFLRFVMFVSLPALILKSISESDLSESFLLIPLIAIAVFLILMMLGFLVAGILKIEKKTKATLIMGMTFMNTGFVLPFLIATLDASGITAAVIFDLTNTFLIYSLGYSISVKMSADNPESSFPGLKLLQNPPLWAFILALFLNIINIKLPEFIVNSLDQIAVTTIPLIIFSLGIYFKLKVEKLRLVLFTVLIRMGIGLVVGIFFCRYMGITADARIAVLISSAAPIGYSTLLFSAMERLDRRFASALISVSILFGMILTPILIVLLALL